MSGDVPRFQHYFLQYKVGEKRQLLAVPTQDGFKNSARANCKEDLRDNHPPPLFFNLREGVFVMNCEVCGKKTERTRNRFCSVECKGIASRKPPTVCPVCGELFTGKSGQKTCSRECGAAIQRTGEMSACSQCGKEMYVKKHRQDEQKFCSKECADKNKENRTVFVCAECGKEFSRTVFHKKYRSDSKKFCNNDCKRAHYQKKENAPNWKGGKSEEERKLRSSAAGYQWRKAVLLRDGLTCQKCGAKEVRLHTHHIESTHDCPEKRFDIDNGITLCGKCHGEIHGVTYKGERRYGRYYGIKSDSKPPYTAKWSADRKAQREKEQCKG